MDNTSVPSPPQQLQEEQVHIPQENPMTIVATKSNSSSTTSKYVRDFESLFVPINIEILRNKAQNGNLRHCQFRSLCWRYFLRCLPEQYGDWIDSCKESRQSYVEVSKKHLRTIKPNAIESDIVDNQLQKSLSNELKVSDEHSGRNVSDDDEQEYAKASKECDHKNIYKTIERDVVRTFPDMEFFRQTEIQNILSNILFNFASENPHLSYKQGMHELLATLLYVAHTDSQNCLINYEGDYANESIATLLDLKYLESDVYHLFSALMKSIESWYQNDEILIIPDSTPSHSNIYRRMSTDYVCDQSLTTSAPKQQVSSVLGLKLKTISENIVRRHDIELYNHLEALQIAPQIYGIRWMRLLFGREYDFLDLLTIWDAIICDRDSMSLVDYVFASMLMTLREELINGDYTDCLNNLMRHQFKDVSYVIRLALHLRDPVSNIRPKFLRHASNYVQSASHQSFRQPQSAATSSLTSKLSQQFLGDRHRLVDLRTAPNNHQQANQKIAETQRFVSTSSINVRSSYLEQRPDDDRSSRKIFSMTTLEKQQQKFNLSKAGATISDGIGYLAQQATNRASNQLAATTSTSRSGSKFLPNINKIVSSIGQNIQDKTSNGDLSMQRNSTLNSRDRQRGAAVHQKRPTARSYQASHNTHSQQQQHHRHQSASDLISSAAKHQHQHGREYEMREMHASSSSSSQPVSRQQAAKLPLGQLSSGTSGSLDVSNDSYEDLPSIVDYCWRLLSEQIDSLQRCLPKEKSLHSEDEIFVALAQLKKVRDVLKGSLRLEDELESTNTTAALASAAAAAATASTVAASATINAAASAPTRLNQN